MLTARIPACSGLWKGGDLQPRTLSPSEQAWSMAHFPPGLMREAGMALTRGLHVFECDRTAGLLAATSFLTTLLSVITLRRPILWISQDMTVREGGELSVHGLMELGLKPDQMIFVQASRPLDVLWCLEQAIVSKSIGAAVAEVTKTHQLLDITATRRLSLRAQASNIPVHVIASGSVGPTAALTNWVVQAAPNVEHLQVHLGWPAWALELKKNKNGSFGDLILSFDVDSRRFIVHRNRNSSSTAERTETAYHSSDIIDWRLTRTRLISWEGC